MSQATHQSTQTSPLSLEKLESYKYGLKLARERIKTLKAEVTANEAAMAMKARNKLKEIHKQLLAGQVDVKDYIEAWKEAKIASEQLRIAGSGFNKELTAISRIINGIDNILIPKLLLAEGIQPQEPTSDEIFTLKALIKAYSKQ